MTDVRLTALNPEDSTVVPVACNSSGELLVDKGAQGPDLNVEGDLSVDGSINAAGGCDSNRYFRVTSTDDAYSPFKVTNQAGSQTFEVTAGGSITAAGSASFSGDVVVGSRSKSWMLVEQGGLCHMVEQTRSLIDEGFSVDDVDADPDYPKLRDVFNELDLIEKSLSQVMEKLRLTPPAGWPVWDGSDETQ